MKKHMKSMLLSAPIFPGLGQISIGYKKRGLAIIFFNLLLLGLITLEIINKARQVIKNIQESGQAVSSELITELTLKHISFSDNIYLNSLLIIIVISWFYTIIDAYRIAYKN